MEARSMMIIDNHLTVIEIVIINGGHKLAVLATCYPLFMCMLIILVNYTKYI